MFQLCHVMEQKTIEGCLNCMAVTRHLHTRQKIVTVQPTMKFSSLVILHMF